MTGVRRLGISHRTTRAYDRQATGLSPVDPNSRVAGPGTTRLLRDRMPTAASDCCPRSASPDHAGVSFRGRWAIGGSVHRRIPQRASARDTYANRTVPYGPRERGCQDRIPGSPPCPHGCLAGMRGSWWTSRIRTPPYTQTRARNISRAVDDARERRAKDVWGAARLPAPARVRAARRRGDACVAPTQVPPRGRSARVPAAARK